MERAKSIIAASPGFVSLRVERCIERPNHFLLLVEWDRLKDHTEGFRGSPAYEEWRAALHHYYDPFPVVEHFETVVRGLSDQVHPPDQQTRRPASVPRSDLGRQPAERSPTNMSRHRSRPSI